MHTSGIVEKTFNSLCTHETVTPAKAGVHLTLCRARWIPALLPASAGIGRNDKILFSPKTHFFNKPIGLP